MTGLSLLAACEYGLRSWRRGSSALTLLVAVIASVDVYYACRTALGPVQSDQRLEHGLIVAQMVMGREGRASSIICLSDVKRIDVNQIVGVLTPPQWDSVEVLAQLAQQL